MASNLQKVPPESQLTLQIEPCPDSASHYHLTLYQHGVVYAILGCLFFPSEDAATDFLRAKVRSIQKLSDMTGQSIWQLKPCVFTD